MKQKYDPFGIPDEVHCGDCGKVLSKRGRIHDSYISDGVRCKSCYDKHAKVKDSAAVLIGAKK